ncbi:MAG: UDP-N-acetylglucosamine 2-epimerase (non-hydrolyzing), partial [Candidatus Paceibacterota bacterium]
GKPCITLRPETEWVETVDAGWNILLDINDPKLVSKIQGFNPDGEKPDLYGVDVASGMVKEIENWIASRSS